MTDQDLRKLNRRDLLELLIAQGRERDALKAELEEAKAALEDRRIQLERAGSIAEASLQINKVFEAAQAAAQQYLDNIRRCSEHVENSCARREAACIRREIESREQVERQLREATLTMRKMEEETRRRCQAMEEDARIKSQAYWEEVTERLRDICQEPDAMDIKKLLPSGGAV